jgi:hypothetical protein
VPFAPLIFFWPNFQPFQSTGFRRYNRVFSTPGAAMTRREFLSGLSGAAVWPLAARATLPGWLLLAADARAVDRGQFDNVPDNIRSWFKGVRNRSGGLCCDISDGHRTDYEVRQGAYWVPIEGAWWRVPDIAIIRDAGNPLGEAVVWYVSIVGNIVIRCFVPADAS